LLTLYCSWSDIKT